eukprot:382180-Rhodomonas_salina.2
MEDADLAPEGLLCPLTLGLMKDPVTTCDGQSYERKQIQGCYFCLPRHPLQCVPDIPCCVTRVARTQQHKPADKQAASEQTAHTESRAEEDDRGVEGNKSRETWSPHNSA